MSGGSVEQLIVLVVLAILVVGGFMLFNRLKASPTASRAAQVARSRIDNVKENKLREPTPETTQPGDAIAFSDGTNGLVESVLVCNEVVGPRSSAWRWSFLDDGKMIEAAPDGNVLYDRSEVVYQGSEPFQHLIAEASQGGVLKLFEQRVRAGTAASNPMTFDHAGLTFHVRSTGTFAAQASGKPLREVWRDISPQAADNVYFEAEAPSGEQLLGVWTSHIALLVGHPLGVTDIEAMYPGSEESA
jgi:hypothetical protein